MGSSESSPLVCGLDVNGTIIDGDSFHAELSSQTPLTSRALELITTLEKRFSSTPVMLFTFGVDFPMAVRRLKERDSARWVFPDSNFFFIARASDSDEIWAFPMSPDTSAKVPHLDFSGHDPRIDLDAPESVPLLSSPSDVEQAVARASGELVRLSGLQMFAVFTQSVLARGNAVFRAAYDPAHPYFCKRGGGKPCKVLALPGPVVAFDDNDDDWDLSGCAAGSVVHHVLAPDLAIHLNASAEESSFDAKRLEKLRKRHRVAQGASGVFEATDMLSAFSKSAGGAANEVR